MALAMFFVILIDENMADEQYHHPYVRIFMLSVMVLVCLMIPMMMKTMTMMVMMMMMMM